MSRKQKTSRNSKREQILETAIRLFSRYGAKRVTIEELCREAGVSKMTFYKYFANKTRLVESIKDRWVEEGFQKFEEISALDIPFPEKIQLMTRWKVEFASRISAEFLREMVSMDDVEKQFKSRYLKNIADAQQNGDIRSDIDLDFLWMVLEKLSELVKEEQWKDVFSDFSQYQEQLRTLIYFGLLSRSEDKESKSCVKDGDILEGK